MAVKSIYKLKDERITSDSIVHEKSNEYINLKKYLDNLENSIEEKLNYQKGDTYIISDRSYITVGGSITAGKGQIRFGVFLPKKLTNISNITVTSAKITVRNTSGEYILDYVDVTNKVSASKSGDNAIYLSYAPGSTMSGINNTPVSVEIGALTLTFN